MIRALALAAALATGCVTTDGFLFNPTRVDDYDWDGADPNRDGELTDPHPSLVTDADRFEGFVAAGGEQIHWVYARRPGATDTLFYSHGNTDHLGRYWDRVELLWERGYNVMVYDYPGYGRSSGSPDEDGLYESAAAVLGVLADQPDVDMDRVWLYGYSLGGAPTFELATTSSVAFRGIITEAAFCSIQALVADGTFVDLPREYLSRFDMDNCAKIAETELPVLLIHGSVDDFVVPRHAELLRAAHPDASYVLVHGADHSDIPLVAGDAYLQWIDEFVSR